MNLDALEKAARLFHTRLRLLRQMDSFESAGGTPNRMIFLRDMSTLMADGSTDLMLKATPALLDNILAALTSELAVVEKELVALGVTLDGAAKVRESQYLRDLNEKSLTRPKG